MFLYGLYENVMNGGTDDKFRGIEKLDDFKNIYQNYRQSPPAEFFQLKLNIT